MRRGSGFPVGCVLILVAAGLAGCLGGGPAPAPDPVVAPSAFSDTDVFAGKYDTDTWRLLERGPYTAILQEVTYLQSPLDGADIQVYVMRPAAEEAGPVPVILDAGPYFPPFADVDLSESAAMLDFVSHGYAFALVSVRGTGDSGGCMDLMGLKERADIDAAITWLGTRSWSNGNVGMFGGSYDGSTQWTAASTGNPHLKTIVPLAAIPDLFSFMVRNGTWMAWTPLQFGAFYWAIYGPAAYNPATGRSIENTLAQVVCPESMTGTAMSAHTGITSEHDPLGWWEERDWRDDVVSNYRGSVYLIHGLRDITVEPHTAYPWMSMLEEAGITVKHTIGPWGHELPYRADALEVIKRWYDRWLKEDGSVDIGPRAQVQDNLGLWRSEDGWPPKDAAAKSFYLGTTGSLDEEPATGSGSVLVGPLLPVQDPVAYTGRFNFLWKIYEDPMYEVCTGCPVFSTEPLAEELRFAGLPRLHISVTPSGPGGHVTAILHVEAPDGARDRVAFTQIDLRFPDGAETARMIVPGESLRLYMQFQPTDVVVPAGSKLTLTLHQGSYGLRAPSLPSYPVLLHTGGENALTVDAFTRGADAFHDAPPRVGPDAPPR